MPERIGERLVEAARLPVRIAWNQRIDIETELTDDEIDTLTGTALSAILPLLQEECAAVLFRRSAMHAENHCHVRAEEAALGATAILALDLMPTGGK